MLKLPKSMASKGAKKSGIVLSIGQIFNAKSNFSVVEKIQHLERLQGALELKMSALERGVMKVEVKKKKKEKVSYKPLNQAVELRRWVSGKDETYEFIRIVDLTPA